MFHDTNSERAEAYRILAGLFLNVPEDEILKTIKEDFGLDSKETIDEISADFDYLFQEPGGWLQPFESLYTSPSSTMSSIKVSEFYAAAGLTIDREKSLMPDHLAVEFLFMSYLIDNNLIDFQKKFLEEHIINWVPYYCEEIKKHAKTLFYSEVAQITKDFLTSEHEENLK